MLRVLCVKSTFLSHFITRCFAIEFFYLRLNLFVDQKPHSWKTRANKRTQWRDALVLDITKIDKTRDVLNQQVRKLATFAEQAALKCQANLQLIHKTEIL